MEGYQVLFDDMLSTVWSAPNYCYRAGNLASVLEIGTSLERFFNVFGPCPDHERDVPSRKGAGAGSGAAATSSNHATDSGTELSDLNEAIPKAKSGHSTTRRTGKIEVTEILKV